MAFICKTYLYCTTLSTLRKIPKPNHFLYQVCLFSAIKEKKILRPLSSCNLFYRLYFSVISWTVDCTLGTERKPCSRAVVCVACKCQSALPDQKLIVPQPRENVQVKALLVLCSGRLWGFHLRKSSFKCHEGSSDLSWSLRSMYATDTKS